MRKLLQLLLVAAALFGAQLVLAPAASAAPAAAPAAAAAVKCSAYHDSTTVYMTCSSGPGSEFRVVAQVRNRYDGTTTWVYGSWRAVGENAISQARFGSDYTLIQNKAQFR
jgi:uncharacterized membrane protein